MLAADLGLDHRELVAFVGGGGKSTLLFALGRELADGGARVLATTTTKMGADQTGEAVAAGIEFVARYRDEAKVVGPPPGEVDRIYHDAGYDYVLVEADGARGRPLKVPAAHEPVIPSAATLVVVVMGADAIGRPLGEVAHRSDDASALLGIDPDRPVTAAHCAAVVGHPEGGLRSVPGTARVVVAVTKVRSGDGAAVAELLADHPRIDRVILVPHQAR